MTENVLCALIGVGGTRLGTIVGLAFPYLCSGFGRKLLVIPILMCGLVQENQTAKADMMVRG